MVIYIKKSLYPTCCNKICYFFLFKKIIFKTALFFPCFKCCILHKGISFFPGNTFAYQFKQDSLRKNNAAIFHKISLHIFWQNIYVASYKYGFFKNIIQDSKAIRENNSFC